MSSQNLVLYQIVADFEELAGLTQRAIEALPVEDPKLAALLEARDLAFRGAVAARKALRP